MKPYEHRGARQIIPAMLQHEVKSALESADIGKKATPSRSAILAELCNEHGWSNQTKLSPDANISITSRKEDIGLCLQTGNMGRFYADLLKLEYLFNKQLIRAAIYLIPEKPLALKWGQNIANFDRFTKEIGIFSSIIKTPILVFPIRSPA